MEPPLTLLPGCQGESPPAGTSMSSDPPNLPELQRTFEIGTLLPGEEPGSTYLDDALHWISVYAELLAMKHSLIEHVQQVRRGLTDDAAGEADIDLRLLSAQASRYEVRQQYWLRHADQLQEARQDGARQPLRPDFSREASPPGQHRSSKKGT